MSQFSHLSKNEPVLIAKSWDRVPDHMLYATLRDWETKAGRSLARYNGNHSAISRERKKCDSLNIALKVKENSLSIAARWGTLLLDIPAVSGVSFAPSVSRGMRITTFT
jgi:hypothetical protein